MFFVLQDRLESDDECNACFSFAIHDSTATPVNDMMAQNDMRDQYVLLPQNGVLHEYHKAPAHENVTQNAQFPASGQFAANSADEMEVKISPTKRLSLGYNGYKTNCENGLGQRLL